MVLAQSGLRYDTMRQRRGLNTTDRMPTAAQLGIRPFHGILCARCRTRLEDADGNPCWDIVGAMTFVCRGGCRVARGRA